MPFVFPPHLLALEKKDNASMRKYQKKVEKKIIKN